MKEKFSLIIKLLISFGTLGYILTIIPFSEIAISLRSAHLAYIIIGMVLGIANAYVAASQMKIITDNQKLSLSIYQIISINFITRFYGLFLPGYVAGGAIPWYKLSRPDNKPIEALSSIGFSRLLRMIIIVAFGIIFFILDPSIDSISRFFYALIAILVALLFVYLILNNRNLTSFIKKRASKIPLSFTPGFFQCKILPLLDSVSRFQTLPLKSHIRLISLTVIWRLIGIISFYLFTCSLELHISFTSIGWISSATLIMVMLPISFSGLGIREGTLIFLLGPYGISSHYAVALSFIKFTENILAATIGGLSEVNSFFFKKR